MFNGIIKNTGRIFKLKKSKNEYLIYILTDIKFKKNEIGSSVSCSGACLTLDKINKKLISFYISKETLNRTTFKFSKIGDVINLERSLKYGQRISGHFVQGHVDTTSMIDKIYFIGKTWVINFKLPNKYKKFIVTKGSITINGVSLTIAKLIKNGFQISIIPKTLELTNLADLKQKDLVNVEFDVLGKYIKNFIN